MTYPRYFELNGHVHFCSSFLSSFIFCYEYPIVKITYFGASYKFLDICKFTNEGSSECCSSIQFSLRGAARHLIGSEESPDENRNSESPLKLICTNCTIFYINA